MMQNMANNYIRGYEGKPIYAGSPRGSLLYKMYHEGKRDRKRGYDEKYLKLKNNK